MCVIQIRRYLRYNQVIYFANNDGTIDIVTTHSMEQLQWTNDHEETAAKMFVLVKHIVDEHQIWHLIINSPETEVFVVVCYRFTSPQTKNGLMMAP